MVQKAKMTPNNLWGYNFPQGMCLFQQMKKSRNLAKICDCGSRVEVGKIKNGEITMS